VQGDAVGAWAGDKLAAVLFPTADTIKQLRQLAERKPKAPELLLIFNPQWELQVGCSSAAAAAAAAAATAAAVAAPGAAALVALVASTDADRALVASAIDGSCSSLQVQQCSRVDSYHYQGA
jgi:hypothetical protein